ncbi:carbon-nitrogen hydrolase family protein [Paracoccaceae bacterium]|nr:carbon-nitrogen hydrolase family protein [Paracoccaceae bacterium]
MSSHLRLTIAQTTSSNSHAKNVENLGHIVDMAVADSSQMLALPEAFGLMERNLENALAQVVSVDQDPFILACQAHAAKHSLWIQAGSTPILGAGRKFLNHATMINPLGEIIASYNKLHLFDIFLPEKSPTKESDRYDAGSEAIVVTTPFGRMGLTICYDLRFPHLYRDISKADAKVAFVPSAFTVPTGKAHWEVLLRARAIENGIWIIAAAQVGAHADGRRTWGHSLVISPWGDIIADLGGKKTGTCTLDLDLQQSKAARNQIPSLNNERLYKLVIK